MRPTIGMCAAAQLILILGGLSSALGQSNAAKNSANKAAVTIIAWNIEAGGSDVATIAAQIKELEPFDILALSEVPQASVKELGGRWGEDAFIAGEKGGPARLLIAWDPQKFQKLEALELQNYDGREFAPGLQAAPLVAHLKHTASGRELLVVMNHFARGSAELRKSQALLLSDWARAQKNAVIAVGGFNFDYDFPTRRGNEAFDAFVKTGVWKWIEPKKLVDDNWADRNRDGKDDYPDSMLDFAFAAGPARDWRITSEVIVRPGDFPDSAKTSDHRPARTVIEELEAPR
jgi:hypothetical protein